MNSCNQDQNAGSGRVVAVFGKSSLFEDEVLHFLPDTVSGEDSLRFAKQYVDNWVQMKAVEEAAKRAIPNLEEEISYYIRDYAQVLREQAFTDWLVEKNSDKFYLSDEEVRTYYQRHPDKFISTRPYYQFFYVQAREPGQYQVVNWLRSKQAEDLEALKTWSKNEARFYKLDSSYVEQAILEKFSEGFYFGDITRASLKTVYPYQHKEGDTTYFDFFQMIDVVKEGEPLPLSLVKEEIAMIIQNQRKRLLFDQYKSRLVKEAKASKRAIIQD